MAAATTPATNPGLAPVALSERDHPRLFRANRFVYPVLSRRSGGISIGVNLNPDKACNFDCIYCQVDRTKVAPTRFVEIPALLDELDGILSGLASDGWLWNEPEFRSLPPEKRAIRDVAFSGDGEPTTFDNFSDVIAACSEILIRHARADVKIVLITNATGLARPDVRRGLEIIDQHHGEIWAKIDAGTAEYFAFIDGTRFPFDKVLANILACAQDRAVVIQSCFMRVNGKGPDRAELDSYLARLRDIVLSGGRIARVQVYTVARDPARSIVSSLSDEEVRAIAARVRAEAALSAEAYFGAVPEGRGTLDA